MNRKVFFLILLSVLAVLLQFLLINRIGIYDITADIVILPIAYISLNFGRFNGTLSGFFIGLLLDIISGFWGVHTLTKTITGFFLGGFHTEGKGLSNWDRAQFLQIYFLALLVHFGIYSALNYLHIFNSFWDYLFVYVLGQSLYSLVFGIMFSLLFWGAKRY